VVAEEKLFKENVVAQTDAFTNNGQRAITEPYLEDIVLR